MRIVHLCRVAPPDRGGMEAVVDGLSAAQARAGHDVRIVTVAPGAATVTAAGVPVVRLRPWGPRRWPMARGLGAALSGAEVVHVHGIDGLADQVLTARPAGARVGVSTHGGFLHGRRAWAVKQLWLRTLTRVSLARADAVWFTSEADRGALAPAGLVGEVVPDGVDLGPFRRVVRAPEPGRWLVPGRVDRHKGIDDLIRAVAPLARPGGPDFQLRVVGRAGEVGVVEALRALARAEGLGERVVFVGEVEQGALVAELAACELAIFPSRHEGFGLALVEAMAAGVAPVARPIAAFAEHLTDGVDGDLVAVDGAFAARLLGLRAAPRAAMEAAARASAEAWSWEAVAPVWEAAYARLLERP